MTLLSSKAQKCKFKKNQQNIIISINELEESLIHEMTKLNLKIVVNHKENGSNFQTK